MEFPDLHTESGALVDEFCARNDIASQTVRVVASPYRICPLGAHIDHQGGPVLGMTVGAYTTLAYAPSEEPVVSLRSRNYPDPVSFDLNDIPPHIPGAWGHYLRGAALALKKRHRMKRGITGLVSGMLPGAGLSSSASVLVAYLHALAAANDIAPGPWDYVRLTQQAENQYIGLKNGILDQTSIVFGQKDHLLHIDTRKPSVEALPDRAGAGAYRILIAYSGFARELTATGYNTRVQECRQAARALSRLEGQDPAAVLSEISEAGFLAQGKKLDPALYRRARHFFGEVRRVRSGLAAWKAGRLEVFGRLINQSCNSSIQYYECGSPAVHDLQRIVSTTRGVLGARFSGGGFGGCVVGLVEAQHAESAAASIRAAYGKSHPEAADRAAVYLASSVKGVHVL